MQNLLKSQQNKLLRISTRWESIYLATILSFVIQNLTYHIQRTYQISNKKPRNFLQGQYIQWLSWYFKNYSQCKEIAEV